VAQLRPNPPADTASFTRRSEGQETCPDPVWNRFLNLILQIFSKAAMLDALGAKPIGHEHRMSRFYHSGDQPELTSFIFPNQASYSLQDSRTSRRVSSND